MAPMTGPDDIVIRAETQYLAEHSQPKQARYFFAYRITVENRGDETVQLRNRHWVITDAAQKVDEVRGEGVIGEQPLIRPGAAFSYTSFCPLRTDFGTMHGEFRMRRGDGSEFDAGIPKFVLSADATVN